MPHIKSELNSHKPNASLKLIDGSFLRSPPGSRALLTWLGRRRGCRQPALRGPPPESWDRYQCGRRRRCGAPPHWPLQAVCRRCGREAACVARSAETETLLHHFKLPLCCRPTAGGVDACARRECERQWQRHCCCSMTASACSSAHSYKAAYFAAHHLMPLTQPPQLGSILRARSCPSVPPFMFHTHWSSPGMRCRECHRARQQLPPVLNSPSFGSCLGFVHPPGTWRAPGMA